MDSGLSKVQYIQENMQENQIIHFIFYQYIHVAFFTFFIVSSFCLKEFIWEVKFLCFEQIRLFCKCNVLFMRTFGL